MAYIDGVNGNFLVYDRFNELVTRTEDYDKAAFFRILLELTEQNEHYRNPVIEIFQTMNTIQNKEDATTTTHDIHIPPDNVKHHARLCEELNDLYRRKNHDYGDSFHESWIEWGLPMAAIRIGDKYKRLVSLLKGAEQAVKDESIRDTLIDLANYALMTAMELDRQKDAESPKWTKE